MSRGPLSGQRLQGQGRGLSRGEFRAGLPAQAPSEALHSLLLRGPDGASSRQTHPQAPCHQGGWRLLSPGTLGPRQALAALFRAHCLSLFCALVAVLVPVSAARPRPCWAWGQKDDRDPVCAAGRPCVRGSWVHGQNPGLVSFDWNNYIFILSSLSLRSAFASRMIAARCFGVRARYPGRAPRQTQASLCLSATAEGDRRHCLRPTGHDSGQRHHCVSLSNLVV